jgi:uncharacterized integral membrane protein
VIGYRRSMTSSGQPYSPQNQPAGPTNQPTSPSAGDRKGSKRPISVGQILGGLLFLLVIVFIIENSRKVKVRLIIPEVEAPLYVPILIAAVLGSLITWLLRYRRHRHHPTQR